MVSYAFTTFRVWAACILLSLPSLLFAAEGTGDLPRCFFAAYLPSWSVTAEQGIDRDVVELPDRIDVVQLAFMRPDASYASDSGFVGTGLEFSYQRPFSRIPSRYLGRGDPA